MSKQVKSVLLLLVVLALLAQSELVAEAPIVVTDALGRHVELPGVPKRVVSLAPSITEVLAALDLLDYVVGADSFSLEGWYLNISSRLREREVVDVGGYWWSLVRVEEVLRLDPDVVLADAGAHRPLLETFESYNLTVLYLQGGLARSVNDVLNDVYTIGVVFNKTSEAEELINSILRALDEGRSLLEPYRGVRVLVVLDFWQGIWVAGRATFIDDVLSRLGLVNAATTIGWSVVSLETIYKWSPDIILVACPYATNETVRESGLYDLGKPVVLLNSTEIDVISRPGPLLALVPRVLHSALQRGVGRPSEVLTPTPTPASTPTPTTRETAGLTVQQVVLVIAVAVAAFSAGLLTGLKRRKT
jgi:iron complex transport system substrate-binding protein